MEKFKKNIKALRKSRGWTQERMAKKLNVCPSVVKKWEKGEYYPHTALVMEISDLFNVSIDDLLKGDVSKGV